MYLSRYFELTLTESMTCIKNEDDTYNINLFVTENDPLLATIDGGGVTMPIM